MAAQTNLWQAVKLERSLQVHVLSQAWVVELHQFAGIQRAMPVSKRDSWFKADVSFIYVMDFYCAKTDQRGVLHCSYYLQELSGVGSTMSAV